jgi:hypothetical protein
VADNKTSIVITAEDKTQAALASVRNGMQGLQGAFGQFDSVLGRLPGLGTALTAAFGAVSFTGIAKGAIDAADSLNDMSARLGVSVKGLAEWQLAAEQNGTSLESMATGMKNLSVYMVEHGDRLKKAGITATDVRGAFLQLSDVFKDMPEGPERTALAMEIFKKAGMDMLPVAIQGSKALQESADKSRDYAQKMAELAPKADKFNDQLAELGLVAKSSGISLASSIIDPLTKLVTLFNELATGGDRARKAVEDLAKSESPLVRGVAKWNQYWNRPKMGWSGSGNPLDAPAPEGPMLPGENSAGERSALARASILNPQAAGKKAEISEGQRLLEQLQQRLIRESELTEVQRLRQQVSDKLVKFDSEKQKEAALAVAGRIDAEKEWEAAVKAATKEAIDANAEWIKANEKNAERLKSLYGATAAGKFDNDMGDLAFAERAFGAGLISQDKLDAITANIMGMNDELKKTKSIGEELGMTFSSAFEDAIVGGKKFSEVLNGLAQDVLRLVTRKTITEPLAGGLTDMLKGFNLGSLFKANAAGGVYAGPGISAYSGQIVSKPTIFPFANGIGLMGEAGNEAILPLKRGSNGKLGVESTAGSVNIVVNNTAAPEVQATATAKQNGAGFDIEVVVQRAIARDMSRNGPITQGFGNMFGLARAV